MYPWSLCTSVGAWESVPDLERFDLSKGEGVLRERDKVRGGLHTKVLPCIHRLGMLGAYAQVLELGRLCSRLGEIQLVQRTGCLERKRQGKRRTAHQGLTLFAKTWDAWSICTSVGAWESVPDLERFDLSKGEGVLRERDKVRGGVHTKVLPCIHRLGMLGAYAQVLELGRVFQTWRDST